jgi:hypothetical protein
MVIYQCCFNSRDYVVSHDGHMIMNGEQIGI